MSGDLRVRLFVENPVLECGARLPLEEGPERIGVEEGHFSKMSERIDGIETTDRKRGELRERRDCDRGQMQDHRLVGLLGISPRKCFCQLCILHLFSMRLLSYVRDERVLNFLLLYSIGTAVEIEHKLFNTF